MYIPCYMNTYVCIYVCSYMYALIVQGETDAQHQQPMEYAVVDRSKKKSRKMDKQQNVGSTYIFLTKFPCYKV